MREIKISLETATRWYNGTDAELKALAIQTYPELAIKELPKTWKELKEVKGYFVNNATSSVSDLFKTVTTFNNRNTFATKEQAQASIAMAQLSQLMKAYNGDCVDSNNRYNMYFVENEIKIYKNYNVHRFLNFKDEETAELFLENFKDLIQIAKPLL